jgi:hypothetical protein
MEEYKISQKTKDISDLFTEQLDEVESIIRFRQGTKPAELPAISRRIAVRSIA